MSIPQPILEEFLTREELAAELRRSPRTLDRWYVLGVGPPRTPVGREIFYRRASVQAWLHAREHRGYGGNDGSEQPRAGERRNPS
jgi:hypothetical protein